MSKKNRIDYGSVNVHSRPFSLDKFIESDAPGTLSWLTMEANDPDSDIFPIKKTECSSVVPPFDGTKFNKQVIPCQRQCAGCRRWQIESSGKMDLRFINNAETK